MNNRRIFSKILMVCLVVVLVCGAVFGVRTASLLKSESQGEQSVALNHVTPLKLMPVGAAVGIHIQTNGLMVLGTSEVMSVSGKKEQPAKDIVKSGDYILEADGKKVSTTSDLTEIINTVSKDTLKLKLLRDGCEKEVSITPVETEDNTYKIGVWIRDDTQGIGTLSYVDENNHFAALGHGITDIDTGYVIDISGGGLYPANVYAIVKGEANDPGEMIGHILYGSGQKFGTIEKNTDVGIYGTLSTQSLYTFDESKALPVGTKEEMCIGDATIRCQANGEIKDYDIWISGIDYNGSGKNKDFVIEVKDENLLELTGGIIQGMSGSCVLQNGKIVGVVTHVFVNDPTKGYGIFIENMLQH